MKFLRSGKFYPKISRIRNDDIGLNYTYSLKEEVIIYRQYCVRHLERMNGENILESSVKHNVKE
jgi:hypothetical protein